MKPSIKKLQDIFNLEASRGYDNGAVFGGLERLLTTWEAEAQVEGLNQELIEAVLTRLRDYARLSPNSRAESLKGLWHRIRREEKISAHIEAPLDDKHPEKGDPELKVGEAESVEDHPEPMAKDKLEKVVDKPLEESPDLTPEPAPKAAHEPTTETTQEPAPETVLELTAEPTQKPAPEAAFEPTAEPTQEPVPETVHDPTAEPPPEPTPQPSEKQEPDDSTRPSGLSQRIEQPAALDASVTVLTGVGDRHAQTLGRLNLFTLGDMLYHYPRRYDDYTQIKPINRLWYGEEVTVIGSVEKVSSRSIHNKRMRIVEALIGDGSGILRVTWFNQPWIAKRLRSGTLVVLSGKIDQYLGRLTMNNPEWELLEKENLHTNRIVPVYPLTAKLTQRWLRRIMHRIVTYWAPRVRDPLPENIRHAAELDTLSDALLQVHFPNSWERLKQARFRLAFDEIFLLQLGVLRQKRNWRNRPATRFTVSDEWLAGQYAQLPFSLTQAQQGALADMRADLSSGQLMNRLLQGDVGSGKTVIAAMGIAMVTQQDAQAAVMAPTSILAEQHYQSMTELLVTRGSALRSDQIRLMIGATPEREKNDIRAALADGSVKLVIGTHALIEDPVVFRELALVVIDEQHRFGVQQRASLRAKGTNPHLLVMTATPIPRSLSLTVYGDLDLSVIDELPPGRQVVDTHVLFPRERERAYTLIRNQVEAGHQAFIIYPLVEESEKSEARAAVEEHRRLQADVFPGLNLGLLHGRMKAEDKERVMTQFRDGEYQILVSTSVVEVGVDVPNATVMVIEGANRFGLAQLHQFRGRVGRGTQKAYCLLIAETDDATENERLMAMVATNDGFELAERDLEQRGPGDFLGTRQSGFSDLRLAKLTDVRLIEKARRFAQQVFDTDPILEEPQHQLLAEALENFWDSGKGDLS